MPTKRSLRVSSVVNGYTIPTAVICAVIAVMGAFLNTKITMARNDRDEIVRLKTALDTHLELSEPLIDEHRQLVPAVARIEERTNSLMGRQQEFHRDIEELKRLVRQMAERAR